MRKAHAIRKLLLVCSAFLTSPAFSQSITEVISPDLTVASEQDGFGLEAVRIEGNPGVVASRAQYLANRVSLTENDLQAVGDNSVTLSASNLSFGVTAAPGPITLIDVTFSVEGQTGNLVSSGSGTFGNGLTVVNGANVDTLVVTNELKVGSTIIDSGGNVSVGGDFSVAANRTVNMGGNRVQGVAAPVAATDATNKAYVDTADAAINTRIDAANDRITNANQRIDEAEEGIAMALAVQNPDLVGAETFGISVNWGNFEGANALGLAATGVLGKDLFGGGERTALTAGFGYGAEQNTVGGRAGIQFTW